MYIAKDTRYDKMKYNRCGASGLLLPAVSLGLWHNFGSNGNFDNMVQMCETAFDNGITHFDLANNYGPAPGCAEENFGRILEKSLGVYRDELIISTKAGYDMWPGPYGNWGSKKYLVASLDQSLRRMGLEYVDIFYHHRLPCPDGRALSKGGCDNAGNVKQGTRTERTCKETRAKSCADGACMDFAGRGYYECFNRCIKRVADLG